MPGFVVQGPKSDDRDSLGSKNRLIPIFFRCCCHDLFDILCFSSFSIMNVSSVCKYDGHLQRQLSR